jgi:hypothetical protein
MDDDLARRLQPWVDGYVQAWDSNDPAAIGALFGQDAAYYTEPTVHPGEGETRSSAAGSTAGTSRDRPSSVGIRSPYALTSR